MQIKQRQPSVPIEAATAVYHIDNPSLTNEMKLMKDTIEELQRKLRANEDKVDSFEKFLNYSNPLGQAYSLKPGRSLIYLEVNYAGLACPGDLANFHKQLDRWNYSPVPFLEFGKRSFITITRLQNGDFYEGQWNQQGKRDGFGYALVENGSAIYEGYWHDGLMHGSGRFTNKMGYYQGEFKNN